MKISRLNATALAFVVSAAAQETPCMSLEDAQQVADNFLNFQSTYNEFSITLAKAAMAPNFTEYAGGTAFLINNGCANGPEDVDKPIFTSREQWMKGQSQQPLIPLRLLNLWHECRVAALRWRIDSLPESITGITVLETSPSGEGASYPWLIETIYNEMNSGAWMVNLDLFTPTCEAASNSTGGNATRIR